MTPTRTWPGPDPAPYHLIQHATYRHAWWRRWLIGAPVFLAVWLAASVAFTFAGLIAASLTSALPASTDPDVFAGELVATPAGLFTVAAGLAALIPAAIAAQAASHRLRPGFLASVTGRVRWRYLGVLTGVAAVVSAMLILPDVTRAGPPLWALAATALLVIPFQAAGEEVFFRGWLLHTFSRARHTPVVAVAASSVLFAAAHTLNGVPTVAAYTWFALFGVTAAVLTIITGGLEAAVGLHVAHNTVAMVALSLSGNTPAVALDAGQVGWGYVGTSAAVMFLYAAFAVWLARRWGLATVTAPAPAVSRAAALAGAR